MDSNQVPQGPPLPYPSFSLVMTRLEQYPCRLPAYRSSYLNRHHPYPRVNRPLDLMRTVDARDEDEDDENSELPIVNPDLFLRRRGYQSDNDSETGTVLLENALNPHANHHASSPNRLGLKRTSFTSLIIDLSLRVRCRCRRVLAAAGRPSQSSLARAQVD